MRQLPNILTISRIVLAAFFAMFLAQGSRIAAIIAAVIFFLASLTDYYDGYFARKQNLPSNFGAIMDPIADKFLILAAFFIFAQMGLIPLWMFFIIFAREALVTGSRLLAMRRGKVIAAEKAGKCKTVSQIVAISVILISIILQRSIATTRWTESILMFWQYGIFGLMLITVILTLYSGILYFWHNRKGMYA